MTLGKYSNGYHKTTRDISTCAQPQGRRSQHIFISPCLIGESSGHTLTSAQPLGSHPAVLIDSDILLNISLSHRISQENHLEYHIISTSYQRERHTQLMGFITPHRGTHCSIFISERNHKPTSWKHSTHRIPHPTQGNKSFLLRLREEPHTHLMGTPNSLDSSPHTGAHNVPSPSQRGTTHPSHGHTQLMGSLTGRLTQSVSWRMSHVTVIINTPSQLGMHSPPGPVSHGTRTLFWQAIW